MNCPNCQTVMREREKEDVVIDVCPNCKGIWLDHGELEKLVEIEQGRGGRYRRYYDDDDDDDRSDTGRGGGRQKKKKGFLGTLMETIGGEGAED